MKFVRKSLQDINTKFFFNGLQNNIYLILTLIVILASVLVLLYLGKKSLWQDEATSVAIAKQDWETFSLVMSGRPNMPLYHMMLHRWIRIGDSEFIIRSLSAIFALATVPMLYALGARMFGSRVGILAALLLTVNAFFIRYAQEARAYSLVLMLVTLSSYFFVLSIERPSLRYWIGYVISSVLAVFSHLFAVFVLLTQGASLIFLRRRDVQWKSLLISDAAIILMTLPLAIMVLSTRQFGLSWIPQPNLNSFLSVFHDLAGGSLPLLTGYFLLFFYTLIVAIRTFVKYKRSVESWHYFFILTWLFIPIVLSFSYSLYKPLFWSRYLIICLPSLILLGAVGLSNLQRRSGRIFEVSLVIMLILSGSELINWYTRYDKEGGENWREATRYVLSMVQTGDTIFFEPPYASQSFDYYLHRLNTERYVPDSIYRSSEAYVKSGIRGGEPPGLDKRSLEQIPRQYQRFWIVRRIDIQPNDAKRSVVQISLQRKSRLVQWMQFKNLTILLYETLPP